MPHSLTDDLIPGIDLNNPQLSALKDQRYETNKM